MPLRLRPFGRARLCPLVEDMSSTSVTHAQFCRDRAEHARSEANAATLENVRDRCMRSMAVWNDLAVRADRVAIEREAREAATTARASDRA